jgi:cation diffusion facilitator CzcD-associated flavoprotein CzcO
MGSSYSPFCIPFNNTTLRTPRKIRVICIGAGLAGLTLAYKIQHEAQIEDFVDLAIYERQADVGGTWLANRYPGLTCDVPIHVYTLPWCPKHDWTDFMASGTEIRQYIKDVATKLDLEKYVQLNSRVVEANWNDGTGKWDLKSEWACTLRVKADRLHQSRKMERLSMTRVRFSSQRQAYRTHR